MATFSAIMYAMSTTQARFEATFSGGDASYDKPRYCQLSVGGKTYQISSSESEGGENNFARTVTGLSPDTTYSWTATLGYIGNSGSIVWTSYTDSGSFSTGSESTGLTWSWTASTARQEFYSALTGALPIEYARASVWNELVEAIASALSQKGLSWNSTYASKAGTRAEVGQSLSAVMFNSAKYNADRLSSTGVGYVSSGQRIYGSYIAALANAINNA